MERVARAARIGGILTVALGVIAGALVAVLALLLQDAGGSLPLVWLLTFPVIVSVLYILPGSVLLWLAGRLDAGALWAFIPILVIVLFGLSALLLPFGIPHLLSGIALRLPLVYVLAIWFSGVPEYRDHLRQRRRRLARRGRGFEVLPVGQTAGMSGTFPKPPPPARVPPRPVR